MKTYHITYQPNISLRIFATLIDYTIYSITAWAYVMCIGTEKTPGHYIVDGIAALPLILLWLLYFVVTETINQATPGHDVMKLRVIKKDGERISLGTALKRRLADCIDFTILCIPAFICINSTAKGQRLGDLWAGTVVVKKSDIIEQEVIF